MVRGDDNRTGTKRARIMSASGREIVGPGFSSLSKVVAREVGRGEGESSQEKSEAKDKESGQLAGVPEVQMHRGKQGGQGVKTTLPSTAPAPRWCPPGLTKTQRRHIQKLGAREIEERTREAERDAWFNKEHPMITSKKTWKEKRIEKEGRDNDSGSREDAAVGEPGRWG
jgi:hypothetical protein